jgi:hypothetical protein
MTDPVAEPFRWTGATTGQVDVRARIRMSDDVIAVGGPVTTVSLQRLRSVWYVLGTSTSAIRVVDPRPRDVIRSPLPVMVVAPAVDGQLRVRVTADRYGRDTELGSATLTSGILGGGGEVAGQVPFGRPTATTGSVVFTTTSGRNGEVWAATVVRVRFAKAQPPRILQVTTSPQLSKKDGWLLLPDLVSVHVTATGADRARLVSTPTGTAAAFHAKVVAEDTTVANGLRLTWHPEGSGYLSVQVVGPGGIATRELGSYYHE